MKIFAVIFTLLFLCIAGGAEIRLNNTFSKNAEGWSSPKYWNGILIHKNQSMQLKSENRNGRNFGRCSKMFLADRHLTGSVYKLSFDSRGKGSLKIGCMIYPYSPAKPYVRHFHSTVLTSAFKKSEFILDFSKIRTERIALIFECGKDSEMEFDNVTLEKMPSSRAALAEDIVFNMKDMKNGIINLKSSVVTVNGKKQLDANKSLQMDGQNDEIILTGAADVDIWKGFTADLICRKGAPAGNSAAALAYDGLFQSAGSFILARYGRSFYLLVHDGKKYQKAFLSNYIFPEKTDKSMHHIAMTCKYHEAIDQGEIWTEVQIYVDGKAVLNRKLPKIKLRKGASNWEFAGASNFGKVWNFGGEVAGGGLFPRVLTENEIRKRVLSYRDIVKPDFDIPAEVTPLQKQVISQQKLSAEHISACENLCKSSFAQWRKVVTNHKKYLSSYGKEVRLTILNMPDEVRILSLFDTENRRELLNWNNAFFKIHFVRGSDKKTLSMADLKNNISSISEKNGILEFTVEHKRDVFPALSGKSHWRFNGRRLEYSLEVNSDTYASLIDKVTLPALNIAPLDEADTSCVVPEAGGLLYKNAVASKLSYNGIYPRMLTSMQCGAVYDSKSGVYFSPADPLGRVKNYSFRIDTDGSAIDIDYDVAYDAPNRKNSFSSEAYAAVEVFNGDWYDVGLIYRKELADTQAVWWRKTLPNTDTPDWFRKNTLDLLMFHIPDLDMAIKIREFLGLPFAVQHWYWWERGAGHHLCPLPRPNMEYLEYAKLMKEYGIRVLSYTNGRLWSSKDCRGEGTLFETDGKSAAVKKKDGSVQMEPYGAPCAVLCPDNDLYRKYMFNMVTSLVGQGISGCFMDQLGAARAILCYSDKHGHRIKDNKSWNVNGHLKAFTPIREYWRKNAVDAIMTTEDNSEHCVGMIDGLTPWRWMHDNQIPLHAMVYSGRTQYISRDPVGEDLNASFVKAAVQIAQGEQIGHFGIVQFCSPSRGIFRRYVKRLMHLRLALIDFFNCGMMQREVKFKVPMKKIYTKWGNHGTRTVGTLPIIAGKWKYQNCTALILINTTDKVQQNSIANEDGNPVVILKSSDKKGTKDTFELEPYGCELRIYGNADEKLLADLNRTFEVIRKTFTERDPFGTDNMQFKETPVFDPQKWQKSAASPIVLGARANYEKMVLDNVFYGVFYAGIADFKTPSKGCFEVEMSAPSYSGGGNIEVWLDHPDNGKKIGGMVLNKVNVLTQSWDDYRKYRFNVTEAVGGKHKVFFKLNGGSVCNFRDWRWIPEVKK